MARYCAAASACGSPIGSSRRGSPAHRDGQAIGCGAAATVNGDAHPSAMIPAAAAIVTHRVRRVGSRVVI